MTSVKAGLQGFLGSYSPEALSFPSSMVCVSTLSFMDEAQGYHLRSRHGGEVVGKALGRGLSGCWMGKEGGGGAEWQG